MAAKKAADKRKPAEVHAEHNQPNTPEHRQCICAHCKDHRAERLAAAKQAAGTTDVVR